MGYTKFKPDNSIEGQFESGITIDIEGDFAQSRLRNNTESQKTESDDTHRRLREFDQITKKFREKYINKFGTHFHHPKFKWQKSFYDHIIRNQNDYEKHWNYTMNNFSKHNLPENWKYTGLNFPELIDDINDDKMI